jgi:5-methylcytosine-specific restriction endonuclease McrA
MLGWLRKVGNDLFGGARSAKWPARRRRHLADEPDCQACGSGTDLEVHHVVPVSAGGDELPDDPRALITLCRQCHLVVAHAGNWSSYRPDVRRLASILRSAEVRHGRHEPVRG